MRTPSYKFSTFQQFPPVGLQVIQIYIRSHKPVFCLELKAKLWKDFLIFFLSNLTLMTNNNKQNYLNKNTFREFFKGSIYIDGLCAWTWKPTCDRSQEQISTSGLRALRVHRLETMEGVEVDEVRRTEALQHWHYSTVQSRTENETILLSRANVPQHTRESKAVLQSFGKCRNKW